MKYYVEIPIAGSIGAEVEAECKEDAIEKVMEMDWNIEFKSESGEVDLNEIDQYHRIVSGNVCHVPCWEAYAEES